MRHMHGKASEFVSMFLAGSAANSKASLAPFEKCDRLPTELKCPIYGINQLNLDTQIHGHLEKVHPKARIRSQQSADGRTQQWFLLLPIVQEPQQQQQRSYGSSGGRRTEGDIAPPQTLDRPLLAIVGALGCALAVYYRWQNGLLF